MSLKYSYTTADYLAWNEMTGLIRRLYADGNYTISLLLACGSFWGLRISDLRNLTWEEILDKDTASVLTVKDWPTLADIRTGVVKRDRDEETGLDLLEIPAFVVVERRGNVYVVEDVERRLHGYGVLHAVAHVVQSLAREYVALGCRYGVR